MSSSTGNAPVALSTAIVQPATSSVPPVTIHDAPPLVTVRSVITGRPHASSAGGAAGSRITSSTVSGPSEVRRSITTASGRNR